MSPCGSRQFGGPRRLASRPKDRYLSRMFREGEAYVRDFGRRVRSRLHGLVGHNEDAAVLWARTVPGWLSRAEIRLLYRTVANSPGPGDVAEIGSWKGRSTVALARAIRDGNLERCRLFAIDHHVGSDEEEHREVVAREGSTLGAFRRNVRMAGVTDLIEELTMPAAAAAVAVGERSSGLRFVFIDGAHDESSVRQDIRSFLPLVIRGGLIALHDCRPTNARFPGVWKAYCEELRHRAEEVGRADSLLVVRPLWDG